MPEIPEQCPECLELFSEGDYIAFTVLQVTAGDVVSWGRPVHVGCASDASAE